MESWRGFRRHTLQPLGNRIAMELSDKLEREITITFPESNAGDVRARAAAVASLVKAGMGIEDATMKAGL